MKYHKIKLDSNFFNRLICKIFGHRLNEKPQHKWCERCGLAYSEAYYPDCYYTKSQSEVVLEMAPGVHKLYHVKEIGSNWVLCSDVNKSDNSILRKLRYRIKENFDVIVKNDFSHIEVELGRKVADLPFDNKSDFNIFDYLHQELKTLREVDKTGSCRIIKKEDRIEVHGKSSRKMPRFFIQKC